MIFELSQEADEFTFESGLEADEFVLDVDLD
jgi:hypothetical protein